MSGKLCALFSCFFVFSSEVGCDVLRHELIVWRCTRQVREEKRKEVREPGGE